MRRRGKKLLDIEWERQGVKLKIPVRAVTEHDDDKHEEVMSFYVSHENPPIQVSDTDINVVRKAVLAELDAWYSVDWEIWLMIRISGAKVLGGHQAGEMDIGFQTEFYAIGKDVRGKTRHMRIPKPERFDKPNKNPMRWGGSTPMDGLPDTGEKMGRLDRRSSGGWTKSLVKATPANVAAADSFIEAMDALLEKMHHHFSPKRVEKLLAKSGKMLLGQVAE